MKGIEWRVTASLLLTYVAMYMNWVWPWGLLFTRDYVHMRAPLAVEGSEVQEVKVLTNQSLSFTSTSSVTYEQ